MQLSMLQNKRNIYYTLRFASAMCFIGHGAFGIITKQIWCNYFAVFGVGHDMAYHLMPWVGTVDILLGISLFFYPTRVVLLWLVVWGCITALCRPLSGEPIVEFIERAGNYGAPLTLLLLCSDNMRNRKQWFTMLDQDSAVSSRTLKNVTNCLRIIVFLLLIGHGWLNVIEKKGLLNQYASLGFSNPVNVAHMAGAVEIIAAFTVLIRPAHSMLLVFLLWKMGTELFYPHWELYEWIERGGSYGAILALWFALPHVSLQTRKTLIITT